MNGDGSVTPEKLRVKLNLMTGEKRQAFLRSCNLDPALSDDQIVWKFQHSAMWNERMSSELGERTDEEKAGDDNIEAIGFGRRTYYVAAIGIVLAVVAIVVALAK
jgi:hypothetical protein